MPNLTTLSTLAALAALAALSTLPTLATLATRPTLRTRPWRRTSLRRPPRPLRRSWAGSSPRPPRTAGTGLRGAATAALPAGRPGALRRTAPHKAAAGEFALANGGGGGRVDTRQPTGLPRHPGSIDDARIRFTHGGGGRPQSRGRAAGTIEIGFNQHPPDIAAEGIGGLHPQGLGQQPATGHAALGEQFLALGFIGEVKPRGQPDRHAGNGAAGLQLAAQEPAGLGRPWVEA